MDIRPFMKKVIEIFRSREELDKLVNLPNPKYKSGVRNRVILAVLCYAELRVSELINLKLSDIKTKDNSILINNSKGNSSRFVYVPNYLFHYIDKWEEVRPNSKYLFCSRNSKKLLPDYIQKMVKDMLKRLLLTKIYIHIASFYYYCMVKRRKANKRDTKTVRT